MILMNCSAQAVFNLENTTHIELGTNQLHLLSKRQITVSEEYLMNVTNQMMMLIRNMPHIFVLPSFLFNMDHVEHIQYQDNGKALLRFTNGNVMMMLATDVQAFHQLIEEKAPKSATNQRIIRPGQQN